MIDRVTRHSARVVATLSNLLFPLHFPSHASPCAITFRTACTSVDQVKRLLALSYERFEAIRHKTHCKVPFRKPLVKGRKVIASEIFESETLCAADTDNNSLFSQFLKYRDNMAYSYHIGRRAIAYHNKP